jgi:hypothetical protein
VLFLNEICLKIEKLILILSNFDNKIVKKAFSFVYEKNNDASQ